MEKHIFDNRAARNALNERNQLWRAQSLITACDKLREQYHRLSKGKTTHERLVLKDPARPSSYITLDMKLVDGVVQTVWTGDDSKIWEYCEQERKRDADDKAAGLTWTGFGARWFMCTFILELYLLLRYGIDLRGQEWQDPKSEEGKKLSWILDNDQFASRYKTIAGRESIGMSDPFKKIIHIGGLQ